MAKFCGIVGYGITTETAPGVWTQKLVERKYYGDVLQFLRRWDAAETLNDNLTLSNRISIVADAYAFQNFSNIRYVVWNGVKWKVTTAEVQRPRIVMHIGGVYSEQEPTAGTSQNLS